jgi:hypothetical protein
MSSSLTNRRPLAVTIIGCLYIATGVLGLAFHLSQYNMQHPFQYDIVGIGIVEMIAIISGTYMLRGSNWARWLAILWIGFHVAVSAFHPLRELAIHSLLFLVFAYFLFRSRSNEYFRAPKIEQT